MEQRLALKPVTQVCNLPYRRFAIGAPLDCQPTRATPFDAHPAGYKPAKPQIQNLRYLAQHEVLSPQSVTMTWNVGIPGSVYEVLRANLLGHPLSQTALDHRLLRRRRTGAISGPTTRPTHSSSAARSRKNR